MNEKCRLAIDMIKQYCGEKNPGNPDNPDNPDIRRAVGEIARILSDMGKNILGIDGNRIIVKPPNQENIDSHVQTIEGLKNKWRDDYPSLDFNVYSDYRPEYWKEGYVILVDISKEEDFGKYVSEFTAHELEEMAGVPVATSQEERRKIGKALKDMVESAVDEANSCNNDFPLRLMKKASTIRAHYDATSSAGIRNIDGATYGGLYSRLREAAELFRDRCKCETTFDKLI